MDMSDTQEVKREQDAGVESDDVPTSTQGCRVYVGNLPYQFRWWELKDLAREVGDVVHTQILSYEGRSKGCGIIEFRTPEDAQAAIEKLNDRDVQGRLIFVREDREEHVPSSQESAPKAQVYVSNLPYSVRWQDLKDRFKEVGKVIKADVAITHDGMSKGHGTVLFEDPENVEAAISKFDGSDWSGRQISVREDHGPPRGGNFRGRGRGFGRGGGGYRGRGY
eukprot:TRINITY_DN41457_c0_g1_i1.p1 TRINITY_DN41457_c0_g1~~TRINITY_DN41457_c0_g1_i1.p1  ORF type:complete len:222 (-),score=14.84 TRINITY_DN41457_c0_g1_i1:233-898(-)